jgi:hypothetical protein
MGYKEDLTIDKFALDEEWIKQPIVFINWAEEHANAQADRDRKKEQMDLVKAELDNEIRTSPEKFGLVKITEGAIANLILTNGTVRDANDRYLEAVKKAKVLDVAREAFEHKKKALENLTQLFLTGYFTSDRSVAKGDVRDFVAKARGQRLNEEVEKNPRMKRK